MRRLFVGMVVAVATALAPLWAWAGNQEVAERIAANLRESGQLQGYKIGVKFQDGTAWLRGQVTSHEQMNTALKLVFQTPGVTRVVNNLTVVGQESSDAVVDSQASTTTSSMSLSEPSQHAAGPMLQQITGAMAPERLPRTSLQRPSASPASPEAVPATFASNQNSSVNPVSLESDDLEPTPEPTLAPAKPAASMLQPIPIAFTQPTPPAEAPVPQPAPQPVPQPMPQPAPTPAPPMAGPPLPAGQPGAPIPQYVSPPGPAMAPPAYDQPYLPNYAWPAYAAYPNYAALTYPKQYSPTAWPYIGPFYPYPQVPLGWRKVTLEWHDGWWFLDFDDGASKGWFSGLFRPCQK